MKGFLRFSFSLLLLASITAASHAQSTYTAASANESDVNAVINGPTHVAVNGDIIQIPCSTPTSVIWSSPLVVKANITITGLGATPNAGPSTFGAGTNCLTITAATSTLFQLNGTYNASHNVMTIQNLTLIPGAGAYTPIRANGTGTASGMPLLRVDNIQFGNGSAVWQYNTGTNTGEFAIIEDNFFGVADHNTLYTGSEVAFISVNLSSYLGVGAYGDNSWAQPDSFGTANEFYIENNQTYQGLWPLVENEQTFPNIGGGRWVARFNHSTMDGTFFYTGVAHGLDTDGRPRSARSGETYGNQVQCISGFVGNQCYDFSGFRGGTGLIFQNTATISGTATWKEMFSLLTLRHIGDGWANSNIGSCGNATSGNAYGPFDLGDGVTYASGTFTSGTSGTHIVVSGSPGWATNQWSNPSDQFPYSVWDITQGWVSIAIDNGSNSIDVFSSPHGYIDGGTAINAAPGDSFQIRRSKGCLDGAGMGQSALLQDSSPGNGLAVLASTGAVGPANPVYDPIYEWGDSVQGGLSGESQTSNFDSPGIAADRNYFTDNSLGSPQPQTSPTSPFNGTSGVGYGTLANRPPTCTPNSLPGVPGVGYFATDQGSWNTSGNGFGQGTFYVCSPSGAWVAQYGLNNSTGQPYTYPHPLVNGNSTTTSIPDPPSNLVSAVD